MDVRPAQVPWGNEGTKWMDGEAKRGWDAEKMSRARKITVWLEVGAAQREAASILW